MESLKKDDRPALCWTIIEVAKKDGDYHIVHSPIFFTGFFYDSLP
jgi:hypothetical protein